jgi:Flp pilus assembly protein TadB
MPEINFERLISRNVARGISRELDLAGVKMSVNKLVEITVLPGIAMFLIVTLFTYYAITNVVLVAGGVGVLAWGGVTVMVYLYLEYKIEQRKTMLESMLPDYLQIVAANLRSGISLERAMLLGARPEFGFLSEEAKELNRRVFGGQTLEASLQEFASRYRSLQLIHAVRMINESLRYGGAMADLIVQISRDIRNQQIIQKEVAGQLLMYTIFVAFAGIIAAPVLYGLTAQMINVTDQVWNGILSANPGGLPSAGVSFLKPSPPQITPQEYEYFSYIAIIMITAFASLIISAISTGSVFKGLRFMPLSVIAGLLIYIAMRSIVGSLFSSIGGV